MSSRLLLYIYMYTNMDILSIKNSEELKSRRLGGWWQQVKVRSEVWRIRREEAVGSKEWRVRSKESGDRRRGWHPLRLGGFNLGNPKDHEISAVHATPSIAATSPLFSSDPIDDVNHRTPGLSLVAASAIQSSSALFVAPAVESTSTFLAASSLW
jgi:hypothetical protein